MQNKKQIMFDEKTCELMFLSPYAKISTKNCNRYIYYREDMHFYMQLELEKTIHEDFVQLLKKGIELSELHNFFELYGIQNAEILISKMVEGGILE